MYDFRNPVHEVDDPFFQFLFVLKKKSGCTLKEAAIVASVLAKVKVPLVHSAAAIIRLANMDYSGTSASFTFPDNLDQCMPFPHRPELAFYPYPRRQKICIAVQSR